MAERLTRPGVKGVTYDFQDLYIELNGNRVLEITGVDWRNSRSSSVIHGQGELPIGIGQGEVSVEGSLTAKVSPNIEAEIGKVNNPRTLQPAQSFVEWGLTRLVLVYGSVPPYSNRSMFIVFTDEGESSSQGDLGVEHSMSFIGIMEDRS